MVSGVSTYCHLVLAKIDLGLAEPASLGTAEILPPSALRIEAVDAPHTVERNVEPGSVVRNPTANLKPMFLPSVTSERQNLPTPDMRLTRNETQIHSRPAARDSSIPLKPFLLGTTVSAIPVSLPSSTMVALGPRRGGRIVRVATHKSQISAPRLNNSGSLTEESLETYERPRPPPLFGLSDSLKA